MARTIVHVDLDAFYCAIEEKRDPELRGQPFAVGGRPDQRGVVASCSYPARELGVRSAMSMSRALSLCPNLIIVPSRHEVYRAASQEVMTLLRGVTPRLEQLSIDEAFLDGTPLIDHTADPCDPTARTGPALARHLQKRIYRELGLSCSIGVATNKLVAKIATDHGKATSTRFPSPRAICVVPPGEEAAFLAPLHVAALWGVGPKTGAALAELGLTTIGDVANWPQADLIRRFGQNGYALSQHARGLDKREIVTVREAKSISSETTFVRDVEEWDILQETLTSLVTDVAETLQRRYLQGTTVKLKLRWADFSTPTRQVTMPYPTANESIIRALAAQLFSQLWREGDAVRLMGVGVSGLQLRQQLTLWEEGELALPNG